MAMFAGLFRREIEHVVLVDQRGTPMAHLYRPPTDRQPGAGASMSTVISSFVEPSLQGMGRGTSRSGELADYHVASGSGQYTRLFVLYRGRESKRLERRVERAARELEERYGDALKDWHASPDRMDDLKRDLERQWGMEVPNVTESMALRAVQSPSRVSATILPRPDPRIR